MFFEQTLALARPAVLDVSDVIRLMMNLAIISTLAGAAALFFAIAVAALLDDRPLGEFFKLSSLADRLRGGGRTAVR